MKLNRQGAKAAETAIQFTAKTRREEEEMQNNI
jgi:hypothetical protein